MAISSGLLGVRVSGPGISERAIPIKGTPKLNGGGRSYETMDTGEKSGDFATSVKAICPTIEAEVLALDGIDEAFLQSLRGVTVTVRLEDVKKLHVFTDMTYQGTPMLDTNDGSYPFNMKGGSAHGHQVLDLP